MTGYNRVVLMGNLTKDPDLKKAANGAPVADLALAVNERRNGKDGESVETTCFIDLVAWGKQAQACAQHLSKGSPVLVDGKLQFDQWESQQGERRTKLRVRADRVLFLRGNGPNGRNDHAGAEPLPL